MKLPLLSIAGAGALLLGAGCATVDLDAPKEASYQFTDAHDTSVGQGVTEITANRGGLSGFQLQRDGIESLASRIILAKGAERSIDAQYYLISNDEIGKLFIKTLLDAADRGVRVRLLLDDILTGGYDEGMAALDSHPNFEIRIYNPFTSRGTRVQDGLFDFSRVNRRMHNKSFTVDNHVTIIGGRNIADEYFGASKTQNFGDADVVCLGPVVAEVSTMFDEYWNSRWAAPVSTFAKMPEDPAAVLAQFRVVLEDNMRSIRDSVYGNALRADAEKFLAERESSFEWAKHTLVYDPLSKTEGKGFRAADGIAGQLSQVVAEAEAELVVVSPYFVPLKSGVAYFQGLRDRGLRVRVVTNSLAANNHGIVHSGYMAYRKQLLRMGVELYEVRVNAKVTGVDRGGSGAALGTLHTKGFLVDRDKFFLGSFNWDPRSAIYNTELGVVIESAEMGEKMHQIVDEGLRSGCYRLELSDSGSLLWIDESESEPVIHTSEPDVSAWRLFTVNLGRMLPIRKQL